MYSEIWLKELFYSRYTELCRLAYGYLRNADVCEDIVQECFIKLWEKHGSIDKEKYSGYLAVSVRNSCISYIRGQKESVPIESREVAQQIYDNDNDYGNDNVRFYGNSKSNRNDRSGGNGNDSERLSPSQIVENAISLLPDRCRLIFTMSRFEKKRYNEIAKELGISVKTVENQMGKAIKIMREYAKSNNYFILILWLFLN